MDEIVISVLYSCPNLSYDISKGYLKHIFDIMTSTNLCCLCQKRENTIGFFCNLRLVYKASVFPVSIQINNKTLIKFGSRRIGEIIKVSVCVVSVCVKTQTSTPFNYCFIFSVGMWDRYSEAFKTIWIASAFKGIF